MEGGLPKDGAIIAQPAAESKSERDRVKGKDDENNLLSRLLFDESFYYDALLADAGKGVEKANYHGKKIYPAQSGATNAEVMEILEFVHGISWVRDEAEMEAVRVAHLEDLRLHVDNDNTGGGGGHPPGSSG